MTHHAPGPSNTIACALSGCRLTGLQHAVLFFTDDIPDLVAPRTGRGYDHTSVDIRARFNLHPARFGQILNRLADHPDAIRHSPVTLRLYREARARRRAELLGTPSHH
jgi:hypothetical protein